MIECGDKTTTSLTRRRFLAAAGGLSLVAGLPATWARALSAATFKQGAFEVTVVSDGHLVLPGKVLAPSAPPELLEPLLKEAGITAEKMESPTNVTIVRSGDDIIVFDTGSGTEFQPTAGKLIDNLKAVGIDPGTVTKVAFTHAHPDHAWGTVDKSGALNFPNATYYVAEGEWNFWMDKEIFTKLPKEAHPFAQGAQKHLGATQERVKIVKPGEEIVAGLAVVDTSGHTPGHASFELAGEGGLILVGDAAPSPIVHLRHPEWPFAYDAIPDLAVANRKKLLDRAASEKIKLLGFHWPYPGVGYAEKKDLGYRYVPAT
jgi:glyoxylase-like metal-dependent hydrolase (beta-lactamase superfamily II)